jgi:hypothetical protein
MRDPDRINTVLDKIRLIWLRDPDVRLGQLLIAAVGPKNPCPELFYIEEKDLMKRLEEYSRRKIARDRSGNA